MIYNLSVKITSKFRQSQNLSEDDYELYVYGIFMLISKCLFWAVSAIIGIMLGIFIESVIFCASFSILRQYAGGIHAPKEWICNICTFVSIAVSLVSIKLLIAHNIRTPMILALFMSFLIAFISPSDTKEKRLSANEKRKFKTITIVILFIYALIFVASVINFQNSLTAPLFTAIVLEFVLITTGKLKELVSKQQNN